MIKRMKFFEIDSVLHYSKKNKQIQLEITIKLLDNPKDPFIQDFEDETEELAQPGKAEINSPSPKSNTKPLKKHSISRSLNEVMNYIYELTEIYRIAFVSLQNSSNYSILGNFNGNLVGKITSSNSSFSSFSAIDILKDIYEEISLTTPMKPSQHQAMDDTIRGVFEEISRREDLLSLQCTNKILELDRVVEMASLEKLGPKKMALFSLYPPKLVRQKGALEAFEDVGIRKADLDSNEEVLTLSLAVAFT